MKYILKQINEIDNEVLNNFKVYKEKEERIINYITKSKKRSIIGEILLSELLKEEKIDYTKAKFKTNENGKPYIENNPIYFNISHSHDYIVAAINNTEIGIDIEEIREYKMSTLKKICSPFEQNYVLEGSSIRFFELYTLKEAYVKMKGTDITKLNQVEFKIYNNKIECSDNTVELKLYYPNESYVMATCIKKETI